MPKVAESVIVPYCDFCPETNREKATSVCKLCGSLLCHRHTVNVEFWYDNPQAKKDYARHDSLFSSLNFYLPVLQGGGRLCPECTSRSTLSEIVKRLKEIMVQATLRSGSP